MSRELPQWQPCPPPEPGIYLTFSDLDERHDDAGVGEWNGNVWQMHLGQALAAFQSRQEEG